MSNLKPALNPIKKIIMPSNEVFEREYINKNRAVIIKNMIADWNAKNWNFDYLDKKVGDQEVDVRVEKNKLYVENAVYEKMTVHDFLIYIQSNQQTQEKYLTQAPIPEIFPKLMEDIQIPSLIKNEKELVINLWVSKPGSISGIHFDCLNNFLIQIMGSKKLLLFAPDQSKFLYPHPVYSDIPIFSYIKDINNFDEKKYPLTSKAQVHEITLNAGEALFLPPGWWHEVETLSFSISINMWWDVKTRQYFLAKNMGLLTIYGALSSLGEKIARIFRKPQTT